MALIVEDGSQVTDADSYISVVDAQAYLDARSKTVTVTESLLLQAMGELNGQSWRGAIVDTDQALSWPRVGVYDCENRYIATDTVPAAIGYAQAFLAYHIDQGNDPTAIATDKVIQETIDVISTTYSDKGSGKTSYSVATIPEVANLLRCYTSNAGRIDKA
ncbi:MAG: hypothetical protein GY774_09035 [Planctomycetes bacterium]|nr:hypothetical protein [Planctomycetota bacterium]